MASYEDSVFINCPFDSEYRAIFYALVFAVYDCGYVARCALEVDDSGLVRIQKIQQMISDCRFGVHDISRVESDPQTQLPRFNMPLELGLFLGQSVTGTNGKGRNLVRSSIRKNIDFRNFVLIYLGRIFLLTVVILTKLLRVCATGLVRLGAMS